MCMVQRMQVKKKTVIKKIREDGFYGRLHKENFMCQVTPMTGDFGEPRKWSEACSQSQSQTQADFLQVQKVERGDWKKIPQKTSAVTPFMDHLGGQASGRAAAELSHGHPRWSGLGLFPY